MKYIIFQEPKTGFEHPVIFSEATTHLDVANSCQHWKPVSAGYCKLIAEPTYPAIITVETFGTSRSLQLSPRPEDAKLIEQTITFQGIR